MQIHHIVPFYDLLPFNMNKMQQIWDKIDDEPSVVLNVLEKQSPLVSLNKGDTVPEQLNLKD
jgi:hypothetical protein